MTTLSYAAACRDPHLFGPWFEGESWEPWRVLDKALFGIPLDAAELSFFQKITGREQAPTEPVTEAWLVIGRRAAKTVKAASLGVYLATIGAEGYRKRLTRGERGVVQILAVDRSQARVALDYAKAFFEQPMLAPLVERETADGIELNNGIAVEITTNDRRRVRGRTVIAAIFDEVAHWRSEATVNPDEEVYAAVRPAMATVPGALLIGISSPYARRGLLWSKYLKHYGRDDSKILVVQAPTAVMNPTLNPAVIEAAYVDDPAHASAEFGAQFRHDLEGYISREAVEAVVARGVRERGPPSPDRDFLFRLC